jgi:hypothetical protein
MNDLKKYQIIEESCRSIRYFNVGVYKTDGKNSVNILSLLDKFYHNVLYFAYASQNHHKELGIYLNEEMLDYIVKLEYHNDLLNQDIVIDTMHEGSITEWSLGKILERLLRLNPDIQFSNNDNDFINFVYTRLKIVSKHTENKLDNELIMPVAPKGAVNISYRDIQRHTENIENTQIAFQDLLYQGNRAEVMRQKELVFTCYLTICRKNKVFKRNFSEMYINYLLHCLVYCTSINHKYEVIANAQKYVLQKIEQRKQNYIPWIWVHILALQMTKSLNFESKWNDTYNYMHHYLMQGGELEDYNGKTTNDILLHHIGQRDWGIIDTIFEDYEENNNAVFDKLRSVYVDALGGYLLN